MLNNPELLLVHRRHLCTNLVRKCTLNCLVWSEILAQIIIAHHLYYVQIILFTANFLPSVLLFLIQLSPAALIDTCLTLLFNAIHLHLSAEQVLKLPLTPDIAISLVRWQAW